MDVIREYNQNNRKLFLGTLDIPVSLFCLKSGKNKVDFKFSDDGGFVTSVILHIENSQKSLL